MMGFFENGNVQFYLAAFFIGGIPFGLVLSQLLCGVNIRQEGSGSIGATNVLRVLKEKCPEKARLLAALTLLLDALKGSVVLGVGMVAGVPESTLWGIAVLAVLGHCFSPYLWFEGGKGVATGFGVILLMMPLAAILGLCVWFGMGKASKISSISSLSGLMAAVVAGTFIYPGPAIGVHTPLYIIAFLIGYKHIPNIMRLFQGKEKAVA